MNATSRCSPRDATALRATHPGLGISDEESADPESVFFATSVECTRWQQTVSGAAMGTFVKNNLVDNHPGYV